MGDKSYWLAEILSGYGSALNQIGRGDDGQKTLEEALGLARELQNDTLVAQTLGFQGDRLFYRGDYKPARALYEQGLAAATRAGDGGLALSARISLAKLDTKDGRAPAAAKALRGLATEADSQGLKYLAVESQVYLGEALLNSNQAAAARTELERALGKAERLGLRTLLAQSHHLLAAALQPTSPAEARRHGEDARRILDEIRKEARNDLVLKRADLSQIP